MGPLHAIKTALVRLPRHGHLSLRVLRANFGRGAYPLKLNLAVTYWCQYRCQTCNIWQKRPQDELTTDELLEFVRRNRRFSWVDVTGGEIFLRQDVGELLDAMMLDWKRLVLLHFPTNGYLTGKIVPVAEKLARRRAAQLVVTVSLDGDEALNDEIRGVEGGYRHQMETFRALRRIPGVRTVLGMTLSAANVGRFEKTFRACQRDCPDLGIEDFHLNVMQLSEHYYDNEGLADVTPGREATTAEIARYRQMRGRPRGPASWLEDSYLRGVESFLQDGRTPMRCHALRSSCFIDPWGTLYPCITYSRPLGSLRETGMELEPLWNATETRQVQGEIWDDRCPRCWTACEAYPSILGNLLRPWGGWSSSARKRREGRSLPVVG